ncbi:DUF2225 domain-containing protein [Dehalobacter sp. DCM]|uniref:DUF2225 domain-containing protein n=1 Tax=Dehalobacter sp. DCM TaxID=2907827 RepID=UPI0030817334|nr:DUF2225 domain-containing protein [Dehalobacter sp. DCM]
MVNSNDKLENMDPLYDAKIQCILCEEVFTSKKVRSRFIKPHRVDSDFGQIFDMNKPNPLFYYVTVCPRCGFTFSDDFGKSMPQVFRDRTQEKMADKMDRSINYCEPRDHNLAVRTFKLAIYFAQLINEKHFVLARLCHRLAWIYRGMGNMEEEMRFLNLACEEYEKSYIYTDFNPEVMPEILILYCIGELDRRLGKYNEALKYFSTVCDHPDRSRYVKYVNMARRQWAEAVENYREQNK